ncbi:MAG: hypothetical protein JWP29_2036 [Rhodoferax sp.]|nr:hypothetical protein [Rhodoferax sp.]
MMIPNWLRSITFCALACTCVTLRAQTLEISKNNIYSHLSEVGERVMLEAARRAGITLHITPMPLARSIVLANDGATDGELVRIADVAAQYPNLMRVPTPIAFTTVGVYGYPEHIVGKSEADLRSMTAGISRGALIFRKSTQGMAVSEGQTFEAVFEMLRNRRFDIAILEYGGAELVLRQQNRVDEFMRWPYYWAAEPLYFVLNKKWESLVAPLDKALQAMKSEGLIDKYAQETLARNNVKPLKMR